MRDEFRNSLERDRQVFVRFAGRYPRDMATCCGFILWQETRSWERRSTERFITFLDPLGFPPQLLDKRFETMRAFATLAPDPWNLRPHEASGAQKTKMLPDQIPRVARRLFDRHAFAAVMVRAPRARKAKFDVKFLSSKNRP